MEEAIRRISAGLGSGQDTPDLYAETIAKSFCLSIDQAHAVHPNYASKHEAQHSPKINAGLVIKTNQNQRYATNGATGFVVRELARMSDLPIQEFCVRNDCPCGSTIGPIISTRTGVRTVDAGVYSYVDVHVLARVFMLLVQFVAQSRCELCRFCRYRYAPVINAFVPRGDGNC